MGCWTNIKTATGQLLRIRTGHDQQDTYSVGDVVHWTIDKYQPGEGTLLNDVYIAERWGGNLPDDWPDIPESTGLEYDWVVVIKDQKVHELLPFVVTGDDREGARLALRLKYDIQPPSPDLWPPDAWVRLAQEHAARVREEERIRGMLYPLSLADRQAVLQEEGLTGYIRESMREEGVLRQILQSPASLLASKHNGTAAQIDRRPWWKRRGDRIAERIAKGPPYGFPPPPADMMAEIFKPKDQ